MSRTGYFHPASVLWRVLREQVLVAGGGAALLLQVAEPHIAQGVADHSSFRERPLARLYATLATVRAVVFADREHADAALQRLRKIHAGVNGRMPDGSTYSATDPALAYWVHATLMYAAVAAREAFVAPMTRAELAAFHTDACRLGGLFGVPERMLPGSWSAFGDDFELRCKQLHVSPAATDIAGIVLDPPIWWLPSFVRRDVLTATTALLPDTVASGYGLNFDAAEQRRWQVLRRRIQHARSLLPTLVATAPASWLPGR